MSPTTKPTILYGGSFDPPHMGHQFTCLYLLEALGAKAVWLMPSYTHPFNKTLTPFEQRLELCQRLVAPFQERVVVSTLERDLATRGGRGRTYDLLQALQAAHPKESFALAIGADILQDTHAWYRWDDIVAMVPLVIIGRAGYPHNGTVELPNIASSTIRDRVTSGQSIHGLVPASVEQYIADHRLYV